MTRLLVGSGLFAVSVLLSACDGAWSRVAAGIGLTSEPSPPARYVQIGVDVSRGAPGNAGSLRATLAVVLPQIADAPGSQLDVWVIGAEGVGDTRLVISRVVPRHAGRSKRSRATAQERWITESLAAITDAADPLWTVPRPRSSPLLAGLGRIADETPSMPGPRIIILISDLREMSELGLWECGPLPTPEALLGRLNREGLLRPGSLRGTSVAASFAAMAEIDQRRCTVKPGREHQVRELWRRAITNAGGTVEFFTGAVPVRAIGGQS